MASWFIAQAVRPESARRPDLPLVRERHLRSSRPRDSEHAQDAEREHEMRLYQASTTISTASPTRISPGSTIVA